MAHGPCSYEDQCMHMRMWLLPQQFALNCLTVQGLLKAAPQQALWSGTRFIGLRTVDKRHAFYLSCD